MIPTSIKLSATGRAMLMLAASREDRLVRPPDLPVAAARQVVRSLRTNSLIEEIPAPVDDPAYIWRETEDGMPLMLRATHAGLAAVSEAVDGDASETPDTESQPDQVPPTAPDTATDETAAVDDTPEPGTGQDGDAPAAAPALATLREAAQAMLDVWNNEANQETDIIAALEGPMAALQTALAGRTAQVTVTASRKPRENTNQALVLTMLRRPEGATVGQIAEAMGWAPHTVRGFFAGLKKKGIQVETLERVRVVGTGKEGAKGSFTIYHIPAGPES